ncbi:MAG: hypothetical protein LBC64_03585 [Fibromonadaceae bacterium]|nr:hypothetical protein [Fibromonadaceae bacterium]
MYFDLEAKSKDKSTVGNRICSAEYRIFPARCMSVPVRPTAYRIRPSGCYMPSTSIRPVACRVRPIARR